jgi:plastocyanin/RNA-binding protein YhbY
MSLHSWNVQKAIFTTLNGNVTGLTTGTPSTRAIAVTNNGAGNYVLSGYVSGSNATVTLSVGDTVNFTVNASGHPFYINTTNTTGTGSQVSTPVATNNGAEVGVVSWTPAVAGTYYYNCEYHSGMNGIIQVNAVSGANVSVFDDVPENTAYPYVVIGEETTSNSGTKTKDGVEHTLTIHVWSQYRGRREIKEIMQSVYEKLHNTAISVIGASLINIRQEFSTTLTETDGITRHGVMRFRVIIFDN